MNRIAILLVLASVLGVSGCVSKHHRLFAHADFSCAIMTPDKAQFAECMQMMYGCSYYRMSEKECGMAAERKMTEEDISRALKDPSTKKMWLQYKKDKAGFGAKRSTNLRSPPPN